MAKTRSSSWWETFLWVGIFIIAMIFLYQLLKLWNAGVATANSAVASIGQAMGNTVSAIENGFTGLLSTPGAVISELINGIPSLLSLFVSFVSTLFVGGIFTSIINFVLGIFGSSSATNTGQGSGYPTTVTSTTAPVPASGIQGSDFYTSSTGQ